MEPINYDPGTGFHACILRTDVKTSRSGLDWVQVFGADYANSPVLLLRKVHELSCKHGRVRVRHDSFKKGKLWQMTFTSCLYNIAPNRRLRKSTTVTSVDKGTSEVYKNLVNCSLSVGVGMSITHWLRFSLLSYIKNISDMFVTIFTFSCVFLSYSL